MNIRKATENDLDLLMNSRIEMLKVVNNLSEDAVFSPEFLAASEEYFKTSDHTTLLALENSKVIGCASICYITVMPTFDHPTGKRVTEISLDTTETGRLFYEKCGFTSTTEGMVLNL